MDLSTAAADFRQAAIDQNAIVDRLTSCESALASAEQAVRDAQQAVDEQRAALTEAKSRTQAAGAALYDAALGGETIRDAS